MRTLAFVATLVLAASMGCESSITVGYGDAGDIGFVKQDLPPEAEPDLEDEVAVPDNQDIKYASNALLEYFEKFGDDNQQCQGFFDPPANTAKVDQCNFEMSYNQERSFKVYYFEEGEPIPSQEVQWELINAEDENGNPIATIDAKSSGTNGQGLASVKVTTTDIMGQFALKATAVHYKFKIAPLYFNVAINPKSVAPLTVKFQQQGAASFDVVKAYLFKQDVHDVPGCPDLDPTGSLPVADKASAEMNDWLTQSAKFMGFADLTPENPLMFTVVATGYKINGPVLAFGCDDVEALVEFGKSKVVTIVLKDIPPSYKGKYAVINHFDMISALPDDVEDVVNVVIDFFNNPTAGLMEITCLLKDQASTLEDLCENFFSDPNDPDINNMTYLGTIVSKVLNAILYSLLEDNIGKDILFTGKDVGNILKDLEIHSTITLKDEPDATGYFSEAITEEEWHSVSIQWTLGEDCNPQDPDCGLKNFSFNAIGQDVVLANFEAHLEGFQLGTFDKLVISPHSLNFKYGAFLNFIIQKLVLPMLAGDGSDGLPVVDSFEKFFGSLMGGKECLQLNNCCTIFADNIVGEDASLSWAKTLVKTGCELLIPAAADYLEDWLVGLDADTGDAFTLGTLEPCTLYDSTSNQVIDTWGKQEPAEMRCKWDVLLKLGSTDVNFAADFWGIRQQ